jgi:hypothetical protein
VGREGFGESHTDFHPPCSFHRVIPTAARLASRLRTAPALLHELQSLGCPIRGHSFMLLPRLYWREGLYPLVLHLFEHMPLWDFHHNAFARNVLLDMLLWTGCVNDAMRFLADNPAPNYLAYAIGLITAMLRQGFLPSAATFAPVFACCSKAGTMSELLQLLLPAAHFGHVGMSPSSYVHRGKAR